MIRRLLFSIILLACCCLDLFSQKSAMFSMPEELLYALNPAYAGLESSLDAAVYGREQWSGINGNPTTFGLTAHAPAYRLNGGLGLHIENDALGPFRYLSAKAGYSYVQSYSNSILSLGVKLGIDQVSFDGAALRAPEGIYTGGLINHNDPFLPQTKVSAVSPAVGLGIYFVKDDWEAGVAMEHLHLSNASLEDQGMQLNWAAGPVLNATAKVNIDVTDELYFFPTLFLLYDFDQLQSLAKLNATYREQFIAGVGVRGYGGNSLESIVMDVGVVLDDHFSVHYSYDIGVSGLATDGGGSHEFVLRYNLNKPIGVAGPPKVIENPRYME